MNSNAAEDLLWFADQKVANTIAPPYSPHMPVTPLSKYSDTVYIFNKEKLTPGTKYKSRLDLLRNNRFGKIVACLDENDDAELLELLRQITVAYFFRSETCLNHRVHVYKAGSLYRKFMAAKRILVAAKLCGAKGPRDIDTDLLNKALRFMQNDEVVSAVYYEVLGDIGQFNRSKLLHPGLELENGYVVKNHRLVDNTVPKGKTALPETVLNDIISASLKHIADAEYIIDLIKRVNLRHWKRDKHVREALLLEIQLKFPEIKSRGFNSYWNGLELLLLMACANLIFFALGLRTSELLSIKRDSVLVVGDEDGDGQTYVSFTRHKGKETPKTRKLLVSNKLREVGDVLEKLAILKRSQSDYYFSLRGETEEMKDKNLNSQLHRFCQMNDIPFAISAYNWRKTTVDLLIRSFTNGLSYAAAILDHIHEGESVAYGLSSPKLKDDLLSGIYGIWADRTKTLLEHALDGENLGGLAGKRFQEAFASQASQWQHEEDKDRFVAEMLQRQILPVKVAPGIYCVKSPLARGTCSKEATDLIADPARCRAICSHQLQLPERLQIVEENISNLQAFLCDPSISHMQKVYAVRQLRDQLIAWPEAVTKLEEAIAEDNSLRNWFE